jgi:hypothetical protein
MEAQGGEIPFSGNRFSIGGPVKDCPGERRQKWCPGHSSEFSGGGSQELTRDDSVR